MIEILLMWILNCYLIPDIDELGVCMDNVVLEYNLSLWE